MKLKFYLFDISSTNEADTTYVELCGKLESGKKVVLRQQFQSYCYTSTEKVDKKKLVSEVVYRLSNKK